MEFSRIASKVVSVATKNMDIGIFLTYKGVVVQIPVNPAEFKVSTGGNNETMEIINLGDIVIPKKPQLSTISWECFFPADSWFSAVRTRYLFMPPSYYTAFIEKVRDDCKPCRLTVTGIGYDSEVVIEDFEWYHKAGDHEDMYYSITLKEYRPYAVTVVNPKSKTSALQKTTAVGTVAVPSKITPEAKAVTLGASVTLSGTVHSDSYGAKPGKTFTNYTGRVSLINKQGSHPYHITTPSGQWLGWVDKESVVLK